VSDGPPDEDGRRRLRHDLRSPLTIIAGFAELLAGETPLPDEQRREYAQRIADAAEDMRRILAATEER
jgi:signal transduction histidine kinase